MRMRDYIPPLSSYSLSANISEKFELRWMDPGYYICNEKLSRRHETNGKAELTFTKIIQVTVSSTSV